MAIPTLNSQFLERVLFKSGVQNQNDKNTRIVILLSFTPFPPLAVIDLFFSVSVQQDTYLSSLGMLGTTQLNSILFADYITFNNGHMKRAHTRQKMINNNNNKRKQV